MTGKVDTIIGHSQGGLIAAAALRNVQELTYYDLGGINLVTFGSPLSEKNVPRGLRRGIFYEQFFDIFPGLPEAGGFSSKEGWEGMLRRNNYFQFNVPGGLHTYDRYRKYLLHYNEEVVPDGRFDNAAGGELR